jgi:hypothetical protein
VFDKPGSDVGRTRGLPGCALIADFVDQQRRQRFVTLPSIFRISRPGREPITDVDSVEVIEETIRAGGPGCVHVDEISSEPLPSRHTSRQ